MNGYEAYKLYIAIKTHYKSKTYNYIEYGGNIKTNSVYHYNKRTDKQLFEALAKEKNLEFKLNQLFLKYGNLYVYDILTNKEYKAYVDRRVVYVQSMTYNIKNELRILIPELKYIIKHDIYKLFEYYVTEKVSPETLTLLSSYGIFDKYETEFKDDYYIADTILRLEKYKLVLNLNNKALKAILREIINEHNIHS